MDIDRYATFDAQNCISNMRNSEKTELLMGKKHYCWKLNISFVVSIFLLNVWECKILYSVN